MKTFSRKRYWIDGHIQGALATRVLLHWLAFMTMGLTLTLAMQFFANPTAPIPVHLQEFWRHLGPFCVSMLVLMPVFLYDTVRLSHRFVGPVLRLRRAITDITGGQPAERISFRDNDFWRGMAADFNKLIDMGYFDTPRKQIEEAEAEAELHRKNR